MIRRSIGFSSIALLLLLSLAAKAEAQPVLNKHKNYLGLGLAYVNSNSSFNGLLVDFLTYNDLGYRFGLYSNSSLGGLISQNGSAFNIDVKSGLDYVFFERRNTEIRWLFGLSAGALAGHQSLIASAGKTTGNTAALTLGVHFGFGLNLRTRSENTVFGTSLLFDGGYASSDVPVLDGGNLVRRETLSNYAGTELELFLKQKISDSLYLQLAYDLDVYNTVLAESGLRHKIGLALIVHL